VLTLERDEINPLPRIIHVIGLCIELATPNRLAQRNASSGGVFALGLVAHDFGEGTCQLGAASFSIASRAP